MAGGPRMHTRRARKGQVLADGVVAEVLADDVVAKVLVRKITDKLWVDRTR